MKLAVTITLALALTACGQDYPIEPTASAELAIDSGEEYSCGARPTYQRCPAWDGTVDGKAPSDWCNDWCRKWQGGCDRTYASVTYGSMVEDCEHAFALRCWCSYTKFEEPPPAEDPPESEPGHCGGDAERPIY